MWSSSIEQIVVSAITGFDLETARRLIYLGPFLALGQATDSSLLAEKSIFLFTRFIMGFNAYLVSYKFLNARVPNANNKIFIISLLMGFFYAYNPFVTEKMGASIYGFPFSYSLIPIVFYYFDRSLHEKRFTNIFLASLFASLAVAGTAQFLILLPLYLLIPWFVIVLARKIVARESVALILKNTLLMSALFLLISAYWIYTAVQISITSSVPEPQQYILTDLMLDSFSQKTTWLNGFRLMGAWWPYIYLTPIVDPAIWTVLTFVIPIVLLISIRLTQRTNLTFYSLSFLAMILYILFFYKGSNEPVDSFYINLYSLPLFGWMFRAPETSGIFLPLFVLMAIGTGMANFIAKSKYPFTFLRSAPLVILIVSTSIISWPMFTGDFGGIFHDDNSFKNIPLEDEPFSPTISSGNNILVVGSKDLVESLRKQNVISPDFGGTITFADNSFNSLRYPSSSDLTLLTSTTDLSMHLLPENAIILRPFDMTFTHDTGGQRWSRASTNDPLHGPFHPYLDALGLNNNDMDYGQGLIFAWGKDRLQSSFDVTESGSYRFFVRLMNNPEGGRIILTIDNESFSLTTFARSSSFTWIEVSSLELDSGRHTISIENVEGFNVVNLLVLVPTTQLSDWQEKTAAYSNSTTIVYDLLGASTDQSISLETRRVTSVLGMNGTFHNPITKTITIPQDATHLSFEIAASANSYSTSGYGLKKISLEPKSMGDLFISDLESAGINQWYNAHPYWTLMSKSSGTTALDGTASLRIDVAQGDRDQWNVIETSELIPVPSNTDLKYLVTVDAHEVNKLHSKVVYYDSAREPLKEEILLKDSSTNFTTNFEADIHTPVEAAFIKLQFWVRTNPATESYYQIDNIRIQEKNPVPIIELGPDHFAIIEAAKIQLAGFPDSLTRFDGESEVASIVSSPIKVIPSKTYSAKFYIEGNNAANLNITSIYSRIMSASSFEPNENISLKEGSTISGFMNFPSSGYYTLAARLDACEACTMTLGINGRSAITYLEDEDEAGMWAYFTTYVEEGFQKFTVYSAKPAILQNMLLYSSRDESNTGISQLLNGLNEGSQITSAQKINDSSYTVHISASAQYMLIFPHEYDSLWSARVESTEYAAIRLASGENGFYIDKVGEYDVLISYRPSLWLQQGWILSIVTMVVGLVYLILETRKYHRMAVMIKETRTRMPETSSTYMHFVNPFIILNSSIILVFVALILSMLHDIQAEELMILLYYSLVAVLLAAIARYFIIRRLIFNGREQPLQDS